MPTASSTIDPPIPTPTPRAINAVLLDGPPGGGGDVGPKLPFPCGAGGGGGGGTIEVAGDGGAVVLSGGGGGEVGDREDISGVPDYRFHRIV